MALVGLAGAWLLARRAGSAQVEFPLRNPYSLEPALKFGLFFVAILLLVKLADLWLGDRGILLASGIAGTGSASAVALSVSKLMGQQSLSPAIAAASVILAVSTNAIAKWVLAWVNGTRQMAFWLGCGLLTMLAAAFVLLFAPI
jgi:uncharacterized membrane protein (DUF4010 family)